MTSYKIVPLDMIDAPNDFGVLPDTQWPIVGNNPLVLWFQFRKVDMLGERRYLVAGGGSVQLAFLRADTPGQPANLQTNSMFTPVSQVQTVTVVAVPYAGDQSLYSINLTSQQTQLIISGTVQVSLTEAGVTTVWNQNYLVKKTLALAGC